MTLLWPITTDSAVWDTATHKLIILLAVLSVTLSVMIIHITDSAVCDTGYHVPTFLTTPFVALLLQTKMVSVTCQWHCHEPTLPTVLSEILPPQNIKDIRNQTHKQLQVTPNQNIGPHYVTLITYWLFTGFWFERNHDTNFLTHISIMSLKGHQCWENEVVMRSTWNNEVLGDKGQKKEHCWLSPNTISTLSL